jgi:nucleoside-diphosphate-sugar epimerase
MKMLMTGGSGFIGRHLARALVRQGVSVVNLDLVPPRHEPPFLRTVIGDVRDPRAVREAMSGCRAVVHLAAAHHDHGIDDRTYFDVNERGTNVVCETMRDTGVRRMLFTSTVAVYGNRHAEPDEDASPAPESPYGASKLAGEAVVHAWAKDTGSHATVFRPAVVFGPHHFANMYSLVRQIESGRYLPVGDGRNVKSLAYVHNLVDASLYLLSTAPLAPVETFNYVDKPDLGSWEIADRIAEALGREPSMFRVPLPIALALALPIEAYGTLRRRPVTVSRARIRKLAATETRFAANRIRERGFAPVHDLMDGLRDMVRWYVEEGRALRPAVHLPPAEPVLAGAVAGPPVH